MRALAAPLSRPVATGAAYLALLLVGIAALRGLPVGLAPDLDLPRLTVYLTWPNTSPTEMEAMVTSPVESEAQKLPRVERVSSTSVEGIAYVDVAFARDVDLDLAEIQLRERIQSIRSTLPEGLWRPELQRTLPRGVEGGDFLVLQASGPATAERLRRILEDEVLPRLLAVPGVAGAEIYGGSPREIRVDLDRPTVEQGLTSVSAVSTALDQVGRDRGLGAVRTGGHVLPAVLARPPAEADAVRDRIVGRRGNLPLRMGDVGQVVDTWAEPRRLSRLDGNPAVMVILEREPGTNVIEVAGGVARELDAVEGRLPEGMRLRTIHDESKDIRRELRVLTRRSGMSVLAIFLVMVAFHRRLRAPVLVLGSVVFAALATFLLFRAVGLGMNLVTLSGLALAFGMAVDNSIVILENVHLRARGRVDRVRILAAVREVLFPLLAATLTTAVVLMPFLYMSGDLKDYYLPFVLAVTLSLVASLVVALTLTPLLARWVLTSTPPGQTRWWSRTVDRSRGRHARRGHPLAVSAIRVPVVVARHVRGLVARGADRGHAFATRIGRAHDALLRHPWIPVVTSVLLLAGSVWVFDTQISTGSIFPPRTDTSLRVSLRFPPGADVAQADALISRFESHALDHAYHAAGYIDQIETQIREQSAAVTIRFHPAMATTTVPEMLRDEMTQLAAMVSGVGVSVSGRGPGYSSGSASVSPSYQLLLEGPDYLVLERLADDLANRLERNPRIKNVDPNFSGMTVEGAIQLALVPDRDRLAELGLTMEELVAAIQPAVAGDLARTVLRGPAGDVEARIAYAGADALTPATLKRTLLATNDLPPFPMGEVLSVEDRPVQGSIQRRDQQYATRIGFEYRGPRKVGNRFVRSLTEGTELPPGYELSDGLGVFLTSRDERQIHLALALAGLLVFMVTAALFESLVLPFVALLSVPLSFVGVALTFWITGEAFDRTAYVGLILLAGVAINSGLLLVHRAGELHRRTGRATEAAHRAVRERVRPILMTTATSVAGLLPLAFGIDPTATAGWRSMALAGTGGLLASAFFTLVVLPSSFVLLTRRRRRSAPAAVPVGA